MKTNCCQPATRDDDPTQPPVSGWRRGREMAGWIIPGTLLALLPKCPVCLAAYVALGTGIGLSLPTARFLRTTILVLCISALLLLIGRRVLRFVLQRCGKPSHSAGNATLG